MLKQFTVPQLLEYGRLADIVQMARTTRHQWRTRTYDGPFDFNGTTETESS